VEWSSPAASKTSVADHDDLGHAGDRRGRRDDRARGDFYVQQRRPDAIAEYTPPPAKIAVASHGDSLDATLSPKGEVCTSFVLVNPQTMESEVVRVAAAGSVEQASVNAVRAAARSGATVVITPEIRPACCTALRALASRLSWPTRASLFARPWMPMAAMNWPARPISRPVP